MKEKDYEFRKSYKRKRFNKHKPQHGISELWWFSRNARRYSEVGGDLDSRGSDRLRTGIIGARNSRKKEGR